MKRPLPRTVLLGFLVLVIGAALAGLGEAACDGDDRVATAVENEKSDDPGRGEDAEESSTAEKESVWMRIKMKRADGILEGLARGDFAAIKQNATIMRKFSRLERWARVKNEDYQVHLKNFEQANHDLIRQADAKNLEGATLAFFQLTTSCVSCHRVVRDHEELFQERVEQLTHVIKLDTEYYLDGPQQGRPADGTFASGTQVAVLQKAGSYLVVLSEDGVRAFVAVGSLAEIVEEASSDSE